MANETIVRLIGDSSGYVAAMGKAKDSAQSFMQMQEESARKMVLASVAIGTAAVAAGTAMAVMVKKSIDAMDAMSKVAQSAGTSTEVFSSLAYAAGMAGVSNDQLGSALSRLSKNMSDTAKGTGEARNGFKALGIDVNDANGNLKSSDAVLSEVAKKFAGYKDGAEKTALAVNLFGRSGAALIPLLNAGADGLAQAREEAYKFGVTLSTKAAKEAEAFNDNLSRLHAIQEGWIDSITAEVLPALVSFSDLMVELASGTDDVRGSVASLSEFIGLHEWLDDVSLKIAQTADEIMLLVNVVKAAQGSFNVVFADMKVALADSASDKTGLVGWLNPELAKKQQDELADLVAARNGALADANAAWGKILGPDKNRFRDAFRDSINARYNPIGPDAQTLAPIITKPAKPIKPTGRTDKDPLGTFIKGEDIQHQLKQYQSYLDYIDKATGEKQAKLKIQHDQWMDDALQAGQVSIAQYYKTIDGMTSYSGEKFDEMGQFGKQAARTIQSTLGDGLYDVLKGNFSDIAANFSDMLLKMAANAASINLGKALFGGDFDKTGQIGGVFGSIAQSIFPTTSAGNLTGGSLSGATWGTNVTFDTGGYTGPGGKYEPAGIVHKGEYVLNQGATQRMGVATLDRINKGYANGGLVGGGTAGGGAPSIELNIVNNSGQPVSASQPKVSMDAMGRLVVDVMLDDLRRNGPYARQLRSA